MTIIEDKAQQAGKHDLKHNYWTAQGVSFERYPLPVGDYILMTDKVADVIERKKTRGIDIKKMDFLGTYKVTVDSKKDIDELCADICGPDHDRFRDECILAQNNGIRLIVLVENEGGPASKDGSIINPHISDLSMLHRWVNPRSLIFYAGKQKYPKATRGVTLMKAAMSMQKKYGVEFVFCRPSEAGKRIVELLGAGDESGI